MENTLAIPRCQTFEPGPMMTPLAADPKAPAVGGPNAVGSNQRLVERSDEPRLASCRWLGRIVTCAGVRLEVKAVPVGSAPVHCGVRNCPVYALKTPLICHPPARA